MDAFLLSFGVILLAELGDKSQLMALAFATRYRARDVLFGITVATLLVHLGSVVLGSVVSTALPTDLLDKKPVHRFALCLFLPCGLPHLGLPLRQASALI